MVLFHSCIIKDPGNPVCVPFSWNPRAQFLNDRVVSRRNVSENHSTNAFLLRKPKQVSRYGMRGSVRAPALGATRKGFRGGLLESIN